MASIANDPNGCRRLQFSDVDGKRRTVRLGKMTKKDAEAVRVKVESILGAQVSGQAIAQETARWVAQLGDKLHEKLAKVGLVEARAVTALGAFIK